MKSFLFSLVLLILNLNESRFTNTVDVKAYDSSSSIRNEFESLDKIKDSIQESELTVSTFEKSKGLVEETKKQEYLLPSQSIVGDSQLLENIQVSSELSSTNEAVVFPSVDTVVELQNRKKSQFQNEINNSSNEVFASVEEEEEEYVVHAEPKVQVQPIAEETLKTTVNVSESVPKSSQEEPKKTAPQHEDIPSFSEWTQKQLAEAEKKKTDQNETSEKPLKTRGKFRNKNYASPDCGAKIVAANPESLSSSAVLSSLKDEYMLNYCTNRIWFVVELCEAIQATQLDLANFELFSSSPKHFSVYLSHRFPTRDWSSVGKFTAQDSRDVQTFNLHPNLFGKYVKVELHTHYGREQFCPISWVGVYGTSEYEVLAKEDEKHSLPDEDEPFEEYLLLGNRRDSPKNLFSSATDAVLSIVKKATAPFMKIESNETKSESSTEVVDAGNAVCMSPRYITVCNNCSQSFYDEVFHLISCQDFSLNKLISSSFVKRMLIVSESCLKFGLDFNSLRTGAPFPSNYLENPRQEDNYLTVMLKNSLIAALCNALAVSENKVVVNGTADVSEPLRNLTDSCDVSSELSASVKPSSSCETSCSTMSSSTSSSSFPSTRTSIFTELFKSSILQSKKIEPTKTLTEDEIRMLPSSDPLLENFSKEVEEKSTDFLSSSQSISKATATPDTPILNASLNVEVNVEKDADSENKTGNGTSHESSTLESILSDMNAIERVVVPSTSNLPAESIFLRLANRIKNLEINMSLSSTYLEELSKRYRVQLELLSKTLNLTIQKMEERSKADEEKERKREKEIIFLRMQLANLTRDVSVLLGEKNSWKPKVSSIGQHVFFITVEILLVWMVFSYWKRLTEEKHAAKKVEPLKKMSKKSKRRSSLEGVRGHETPRRKVRRPSDEALEIALARNRRDDIFKLEKRKRRRKKDSKCSINVVQIKRKQSEEVSCESSPEKTTESRAAEVVQVPEFVPNKDIEITNRFAAISSPTPPPEVKNSVSRAFQGFPSPTFMKTALAVRNSRLKSAFEKESSHKVDTIEESSKKDRKASNGLKKYMKKFF